MHRPRFEHGRAIWQPCPALGAGRAAFELARSWRTISHSGAPISSSWQHLARAFPPWRTKPILPCPWRGQGSVFHSWQHHPHALTPPGSTIRTHNAPWRTKLSRPALGAGRAASGAPTSCQTRTRTHQNHNTPHQLAHGRTKSMHQASIFCPALHKGRAASWEWFLGQNSN